MKPTNTGGKAAEQQQRDKRLPVLDGSPLHLQMCELYLYLGSSTRDIMYHVCRLRVLGTGYLMADMRTVMPWGAVMLAV